MATIERIDLDDDEGLELFHDVYLRAHDRDIDQPYSATEIRVELRPDLYVDAVALLARDDDGRAVAGGTVEFPLRDNTRLAYADVFTAPEHRRLGHATAVLETIREIAVDAGRSPVITEAVWELDAVDPAAQLFVESCGFRLDLMHGMFELPLPATLPPLRVADGYTLHTWRGPAPEAWAQGYTDLRAQLMEEAPAGDISLENEFWDVERTRAEEAKWVEQGRTPQVSIAVSDEGQVVGHTQLLFPSEGAEIYQWDTLVLAIHRGHGLGLALKVATMQAAADLLDGRRRVVTYNAAKNTPMIRVNEALGFRQIAWMGEYVKEV